MREPTLKPGTRCECRATHAWRKYGGPQGCQRDAVRMVRVRAAAFGKLPSKVPMCEPCSAFHEAKRCYDAKRRAPCAEYAEAKVTR